MGVTTAIKPDNFADRRSALNAKIAALTQLRAEAVLAGKKFSQDDASSLLLAEADLAALGDAENLLNRQAREEAAKAESARRVNLRGRIDTRAAKYFQAVDKAETGARDMVGALKEAMILAREISTLFTAIGERPPLGITPPSLARRFSERLSALVKDIIGHPSRFGDIELATSWRKSDENWLASELKELAAMTLLGTNQKEK